MFERIMDLTYVNCMGHIVPWVAGNIQINLQIKTFLVAATFARSNVVLLATCKFLIDNSVRKKCEAWRQILLL